MWRAIVFLSALLISSLTLEPAARAATLEILDGSHLFSPDDATALRRLVAPMPFAAKIVTTADYSDGAKLETYLGGLMNESNMVVVGLDATHHHVAVHFGKGSGIPRDAWDGIEHAGNDLFHARSWEAGSEQIFRRAAAAVGPVSATQTSAFGGIAFLVVIALIIGGAIWLFSRSRRAMAPGGFAGGAPYGGAPYGPPPYGGMPAQGGMGPVGGGLIGAGLGGIAGYELGKMEGERERRDDFDRGGGSSSAGFDGGDSYDAGGGSSSWDDSSGGGGGGDFGGGGGDSGGGGGSDF